MTFAEFVRVYSGVMPWLSLGTLALAVWADVRHANLRPSSVTGIWFRLTMVGIAIAFVRIPIDSSGFAILFGGAMLYLLWLFVVTTLHSLWDEARRPWY